MGPRGPSGPPGKNGDDVSKKTGTSSDLLAPTSPTRLVPLDSTERLRVSNRVMLENPAVLVSVDLLALR